jgi:hypothetical protein
VALECVPFERVLCGLVLFGLVLFLPVLVAAVVRALVHPRLLSAAFVRI